MTSTRNYNPTTEELTASIKEILVANPDLVSSGKASSNAKQVHTKLQEKHPAWKVPERRVAKFTKRAAGGTSPAAANSADEERSVSTRGSLRKFLSPGGGRASKRNNNTAGAESDDDASVSTRGSIRSFLSKRRNKNKQDNSDATGDDNASAASSPSRRSGRGGFLRRGKSKQSAPSNVQTNDLPVADDLPTPDSGVPSPMLKTNDSADVLNDDEEPKLLASPVNTMEDDEPQGSKKPEEDGQTVEAEVQNEEVDKGEAQNNLRDGETNLDMEEKKVESSQTSGEAENAMAEVAPAAVVVIEKDTPGKEEEDVVAEEKKEASPSKEQARQDTAASNVPVGEATSSMLSEDNAVRPTDETDSTPIDEVSKESEAVVTQVSASAAVNEEEEKEVIKEEQEVETTTGATETKLPVVETIITSEEEERGAATPTAAAVPATPFSKETIDASDPDPPLSTFSNHDEEDRHSPEKLEQALSSLPIDLAADATAIQAEQDASPQEQQEGAVITATEHDTDPPMDLFDVETFVTTPSTSLPESPFAKDVDAEPDEAAGAVTSEAHFHDLEPAVAKEEQYEADEAIPPGKEEEPRTTAANPSAAEAGATSSPPFDKEDLVTKEAEPKAVPPTPTTTSGAEQRTKDEEQPAEETVEVESVLFVTPATETTPPTASTELPVEEKSFTSDAAPVSKVKTPSDVVAPPEETVSSFDFTPTAAAAVEVVTVTSPKKNNEHENNGEKLEHNDTKEPPAAGVPEQNKAPSALTGEEEEEENDGFVLVSADDVPSAREIAVEALQPSPSDGLKCAAEEEELSELAAQTTAAAAVIDKDRDPSGHDNEQLHSGMDLFDNFQDTTKDSEVPMQDYEEEEEFAQKREESIVKGTATTTTEDAPETNKPLPALAKTGLPQDIADMITRETPRSLSNFVAAAPVTQDIFEDKKEEDNGAHNPAVREEQLDAGLKLFEGFTHDTAGMFDESSKEFTSIDAKSLPPNKAVSRELGNIYMDDNDGKKRSACQECQGSCVIL